MNQYRSDEINLIMGALAKAQGAYKPLVPNEEVGGGIFANLTAILEAVREALSSNGLGFYQHIELIDEGSGASLLWTRIGHESGQYISSCSRVVAGTTFRETFTGIEAYKRLNALLILGIAPVGKDPLIFDDNGAEQAEKMMIKNLRSSDRSKIPKSQHPDVISKDEYEDLLYELDGFPELVTGIQKFYDIISIADLPKSEFHQAKAKIRKLKKTHEEYTSNR